MKNSDQSVKQDLAVLRTKGSKAVLKHILSPLEQAALRRNYQPFMYNLDGVRVYISGGICKRLIATVTQKAELLIWAIEKDKLAKDIPFKLRDMFDDPRIILALHPRLRNQLCKLECYTLFAIMQKGRSYFAVKQKFSKSALQTLDALFETHNCKFLFK